MAQPSIRQRPRTRGDRRLSHGRAPVEPGLAAAPGAPAADEQLRRDASAAAVLNLLAGIWLIIAPFVLGYGNGDPYWNDIVFGALVGLIALARLVLGHRHAFMSWLNVLVGAWIFASAFWLDATSTAGWNNGILGVVIALLGLSAAGPWSARARAGRAE